ncbi:MAG TPA: sigma-70 family RNA polymerase sigma factor [Candidatus Eisenbacteria bacterium]|jgi:RNA polymerase sigma factor (sigma-70 family)|nr:sigma-70 family RNA polymerase sigma factor [Candidatus Eisenbacteria bacterium]
MTKPTRNCCKLTRNARSEPAFTELVGRHVDFVYSAALRMVGDVHLAEDVTQGVFLALAKNAADLTDRPVLSGWLHRTAQNIAAQTVRTDVRRRAREQEAATMNQMLSAEPAAAWQDIAPHLDAALGELNEQDHDAVLLRYFERKSAREMAETLGVSEEAAQKRVSRAVERLREFFAKRGVTASATGLSVVIFANAVHAAPAALAKSITAVAIAKGVTASGSTLTLGKGALKLMAWTKAKSVIAVSVGVLLAAGTTTLTVIEIQMHRTSPWQDMVDGGQQALKALDTTAPQVTIVRSKFAANQRHNRLIDDLGSPDRWRFIGTHAAPWEIVRDAIAHNPNVNVDLPFYVVLPADMPGGYYDLIANLPNGSLGSLLESVKKKFGLIGKYEMRDMDVLLLEVDHPNAPGLKPGTALSPGQTPQLTRVSQGVAFYKNRPIFHLARRLEVDLQIPVVDQTGLTGNYDLDVPESFGGTPAEKLEEARRWLRDDFGMKLVPARQPREVLVIEKVK